MAKNVSTALIREFLTFKGFKVIHRNRNCETWSKQSAIRPVFLNDIEPLPEFVVNNILWEAGSNNKEFSIWFNNYINSSMNE